MRVWYANSTFNIKKIGLPITFLSKFEKEQYKNFTIFFSPICAFTYSKIWLLQIDFTKGHKYIPERAVIYRNSCILSHTMQWRHYGFLLV